MYAYVSDQFLGFLARHICSLKKQTIICALTKIFALFSSNCIGKQEEFSDQMKSFNKSKFYR